MLELLFELAGHIWEAIARFFIAMLQISWNVIGFIFEIFLELWEPGRREKRRSKSDTQVTDDHKKVPPGHE